MLKEQRQLFGSSIVELERLVKESTGDTKQLNLILDELSYRKTKRARNLVVELKRVIKNSSLEKRPFINSGIEELQKLVLENSDDKKQLNLLLDELSFRKTKRAKNLRINVMKLIDTFNI